LAYTRVPMFVKVHTTQCRHSGDPLCSTVMTSASKCSIPLLICGTYSATSATYPVGRRKQTLSVKSSPLAATVYCAGPVERLSGENVATVGLSNLLLVSERQRTRATPLTAVAVTLCCIRCGRLVNGCLAKQWLVTAFSIMAGKLQLKQVYPAAQNTKRNTRIKRAKQSETRGPTTQNAK